jgi:tripartite-type tricarboxylate transporter receptor subunit TctC
MKLPHRRQFLHLAAGAAALPAVSRFARAQSYPSKPVRIIVPFAPGAVNDITARLTGQWLSERLGQQFLIENRPGGGGNIGIEAVVRAPADGYTLLVVGSTAAINATLFETLNYNFIRDIAPVASIIRVPHVMQVNPSLPVTTVPEFIAYAKANPGKLSMGSGGNGSPAHVIGELFKMMTDVNLVHVPYRGAGPALTDLLGGQIQVGFFDMAPAECLRASGATAPDGGRRDASRFSTRRSRAASRRTRRELGARERRAASGHLRTTFGGRGACRKHAKAGCKGFDKI